MFEELEKRVAKLEKGLALLANLKLIETSVADSELREMLSDIMARAAEPPEK